MTITYRLRGWKNGRRAGPFKYRLITEILLAIINAPDSVSSVRTDNCGPSLRWTLRFRRVYTVSLWFGRISNGLPSQVNVSAYVTNGSSKFWWTTLYVMTYSFPGINRWLDNCQLCEFPLPIVGRNSNIPYFRIIHAELCPASVTDGSRQVHWQWMLHKCDSFSHKTNESDSSVYRSLYCIHSIRSGTVHQHNEYKI